MRAAFDWTCEKCKAKVPHSVEHSCPELETRSEPFEEDCPFCGSPVGWCPCGECHDIACTKCPASFDLAGEADPETLEEMGIVKAICAERFNKRTKGK